MRWIRNNKSSFIEHLICLRHLTSTLTYLDLQRQVIYQTKAILLINSNTVTQIQDFFLIPKLVLSASTQQ